MNTGQADLMARADVLKRLNARESQIRDLLQYSYASPMAHLASEHSCDPNLDPLTHIKAALGSNPLEKRCTETEFLIAISEEHLAPEAILFFNTVTSGGMSSRQLWSGLRSAVALKPTFKGKGPVASLESDHTAMLQRRGCGRHEGVAKTVTHLRREGGGRTYREGGAGAKLSKNRLLQFLMSSVGRRFRYTAMARGVEVSTLVNRLQKYQAQEFGVQDLVRAVIQAQIDSHY